MGDAVYMELALLLAFALFRPLLGHIYSVAPRLHSRIRDEGLTIDLYNNGNVHVSQSNTTFFLIIPKTVFAFLTAAATCPMQF